jgi:hypothetical protein
MLLIPLTGLRQQTAKLIYLAG